MTTKNVTSVSVYGLHKSATMFLFRFFKDLSSRRGFDFYSANNEPPNDADWPRRPGQNCCICPIRSFDEIGESDPGSNEYRIVQIRDPRDMLVSEYYSFGWSHSQERAEILDSRKREIQSMSIDDYVISQPEVSQWPLDAKLKPLLGRNELHNTTVVRYETMVTRFPEWARQAVSPFGFWFPGLLVSRLTRKYRNEFVPTGDHNKHKRAVLPGDHIDKLAPSTIKILNERFGPFLERFGYPV